MSFGCVIHITTILLIISTRRDLVIVGQAEARSDRGNLVEAGCALPRASKVVDAVHSSSLTECFEADGHGRSSVTKSMAALGVGCSVWIEVARLGVMMVMRRSFGIGIKLYALMRDLT
jgi:hypothetical protein